ncbi:MAG: thioredoxin family protein, partial [Trueperaceae bacterium]
SRSTFEDRNGLLVMFLSRHCPFVKHVQAEVAVLGHEYLERGMGVVAIGSNDPERYPADAPDGLRAQAAEQGFAFPYLFDADQSVAKAFKAACTPDFFLFDGRLELVYRGQLDASRPGNDRPIDGADVRSAVESVLAGEPVAEEQVPSMGCNIKWRPGNEPE